VLFARLGSAKTAPTAVQNRTARAMRFSHDFAGRSVTKLRQEAGRLQDIVLHEAVGLFALC
jgi:hypothetical protein